MPLSGPPRRRENGLTLGRVDVGPSLMPWISWISLTLGVDLQGPRIVAVESTRARFLTSLDSRPGRVPSAGCVEGWAGDDMDVLHDRRAALDVSKKDVKVCLRTPGTRRNQRHTAFNEHQSRESGADIAYKMGQKGQERRQPRPSAAGLPQRLRPLRRPRDPHHRHRPGARTPREARLRASRHRRLHPRRPPPRNGVPPAQGTEPGSRK